MLNQPLQLTYNSKRFVIFLIILDMAPFVYFASPIVSFLVDLFLHSFPQYANIVGNADILTEVLSRCVDTLVFFFFFYMLHAGGFKNIITTSAHIRWKNLAIGFIIALFFLSLRHLPRATLNVEFFSSFELLPTFASLVLIFMKSFILAAFVEEFFYSSYLIRQLQGLYRYRLSLALGIVVCLFLFGHIGYFMLDAPIIGIVFYSVHVIFSVLLVWKTRGIEASVGTHAANDVFVDISTELKIFILHRSSGASPQLDTILDYIELGGGILFILLYTYSLTFVVAWLTGNRLTWSDIKTFFLFDIKKDALSTSTSKG